MNERVRLARASADSLAASEPDDWDAKTAADSAGLTRGERRAVIVTG